MNKQTIAGEREVCSSGKLLGMFFHKTRHLLIDFSPPCTPAAMPKFYWIASIASQEI